MGLNLFKNLYANVDGQTMDILENGRLACASFVSGVLRLFNLVSETHATVDGTVRDMIESGWQPVDQPKIGTVLVWEKKASEDGSFHKHIGFYIDTDAAISNNTDSGQPVRHHWTYGEKDDQPVRKIEKILWHNKLN